MAAGQWEFQVFSKGAKRAGDETWVARYILERTAERYGLAINYDPKPLGKDLDWNGSGMHANFSNGTMRESGDESVFTKICEHFGKNIERHISVYGADNDQRLTGEHETQSIDMFSYGVSDRGASIPYPGRHGFKMAGKVVWKIAVPRPMRTLIKGASSIIKTTKEALG
ncbi:MAG: hypothetical protein CM1200mP40_24900 [Gammaproteobacteria bacterium]|nr:MAG: hypothetical protein CM1200mP40_24900 [Gammaproteobacteria bacterium]